MDRSILENTETLIDDGEFAEDLNQQLSSFMASYRLNASTIGSREVIGKAIKKQSHLIPVF